MIYIHKDINFWKTKVKLPDSYLISTDIDDYEVGAYLPLSEEQEQYHNQQPEETPWESWHKQTAPDQEPTTQEKLCRPREDKRKRAYCRKHHPCESYSDKTLARVYCSVGFAQQKGQSKTNDSSTCRNRKVRQRTGIFRIDESRHTREQEQDAFEEHELSDCIKNHFTIHS